MSESTASPLLEDCLERFRISNDPLNDEEPRVIRNYVDDLSKFIDTLDKELVLLKSPSGKIQEKREMLEEERRKVKAMASASLLRRFPPEVIAELLTASLPRSMTNAGRREFAHLRAICRRWRAIALSSPQLWTEVAVDVSDVEASLDAVPRGIRAWFNRAHNRPLTYTIYWRVVEETPPLLEAMKSVYLIAAEDRNWYRLNLLDPTSSIGKHILPLLPSCVANAPYRPWKNVVKMSLPPSFWTWVDAYPSLTPSRVLMDAFNEHCPALERLSIIATGARSNLAPLVIPLSHRNLRSLVLRAGDRFVPMLRNIPDLPALQELHISIRGDMGDPSLPIVHDRIQTLVIEDQTLSAFRWLTLPYLRCLRFGPPLPWVNLLAHWNDPQPLIAFLQRSACPLDSVDIHDLVLHEFELNRIMRALSTMRTLKTLEVTTSHLGEHLTQDMSRGSVYDPLLFPSIDSFVVHVRGHPAPIDFKLLVRYFEDRDIVIQESRFAPSSSESSLYIPSNRSGVRLVLCHGIGIQPYMVDRAWNWDAHADELKRLEELGVSIHTQYDPSNQT